MPETFYFSQHYAPIIKIDENDSISKRLERFGFVLRCMREARLDHFKRSSNDIENEKDKFTQAWLARKIDSSRGNSLISDWENGRNIPDTEQVEAIIEALNLDIHDGNYLRNLAFGGVKIPEITPKQLDYLKNRFMESYGNYHGIAYLLDSYMNIIIANEACYNFLESLNPNRNYRSESLHIIELILDPFTNIANQLGQEQWLELVPSLIWQLRYHTTDLRHTHNYMKLLNRLDDSLIIKFNYYWNQDYSELANILTSEILRVINVNLSGQKFLIKDEDIITTGNFSNYRIVYYEPEIEIEIDPVKENIVFISYKHNNRYGRGEEEFSQYCIDFIKDSLKDENIMVWSDMDIQPGSEWHKVIQEKVNNATVFVALVNHGYMTDSPYINEHELAPAIHRRKENGMPIIPIILSPCEWDKHKFFKTIQFLPERDTLRHYEKNDVLLLEELVKITKYIRSCVKQVINKNV